MPELLYETDANPAPPGTSAGLLETRDGKHLRYALLKQGRGNFRGTVVLLQGRNECVEKYFETMADLAGRGFAVATLDWRGQGGSHRILRDRLRGHVRRFDDYTDDLDRFLTRIVLPDCPPPFHVLAHSSGGLVALASMEKLASRITRMVLCAPLLGLDSPKLSDDNLRRMAAALRWTGFGTAYGSGGTKLIDRPFAGNPLTGDPARFMRNMGIVRTHSELALGGPTVRWIWGALDAARRINRPGNFEASPVPILIVAAGNDRVVSTPAIERFASRTRNVSLVVIDGARHELLQEADFYREQAFAAFDAFIPGESEAEFAPEATEPAILEG